MARTKYIITSNCRFDSGQSDKVIWAKGDTIDLDPEVKREGELIALLNRNGRIGLATKENVTAIQEEIAREREHEARVMNEARRPGKTPVLQPG